MSNFMEKLYAAGALVGVLLICFNVLWSGLSSNPSYYGNYTNVSTDVNFQKISADSIQFEQSAQQIQTALVGMSSPNPLTIMLSVLSLVAYTMFSVLVTVLKMPIVLIDIFVSSLAVLGGVIDIGVLSATLVLLLVLKAIFKILGDQGIVR
jgi:hypothetical protein